MASFLSVRKPNLPNSSHLERMKRASGWFCDDRYSTMLMASTRRSCSTLGVLGRAGWPLFSRAYASAAISIQARASRAHDSCIETLLECSTCCLALYRISSFSSSLGGTLSPFTLGKGEKEGASKSAAMSLKSAWESLKGLKSGPGCPGPAADEAGGSWPGRAERDVFVVDEGFRASSSIRWRSSCMF